jgi:AraC-like DNA-binding protein
VTWVLQHLLEHVAARGQDATPLRRLAGFHGRDLDDPDARVSDASACEAWRLAVRITGDDALGLHMAQQLPAGAMDLLEYAFRTSPTLESAFGQVARYARVANDRTDARTHVDDRAFTFSVVPRLQPESQRQRVEFTAACLVRLAREASGVSLAPLEVRFAHHPPESLLEHRAFFRGPLRFDEPADELVFARSDAALPLLSADAALLAVLRRRLDKLLAQVTPQDCSTAAQVRRVLLENLARGEPTAATVARELGLSPRTLQRRLRAEGTWVRGILDAVRSELAIALLREPGIGIAEIAFFLGYSEPAAFHRSFRRWTGQTPRAFRRGLRGG